jgi:hypothetical protein
LKTKLGILDKLPVPNQGIVWVSGNVYSPDGKSNCVCKLSNDFELNKIITDSEF